MSEFLVDTKMIKKGLEYNILAVFGPQSSGKSTLLNGLFQTHFPTLNEEQEGRHQVTLGVYVSKAVNSDILVFDMEGTDSKERGGQDNMGFERKISLFALSMSEVLIVNMWHQDIGRYNASNYSLLKTVYELNLQLFAKSRQTKTLLLFVIRDFFGNSSLDTLKNQITKDIDKIWSQLMKPDEFKDSLVTDFFDFDFITFPHYVLQRDNFDKKLDSLRERFIDEKVNNYLFEKKYKKSVPIDGFNHYANNIWKTIQENKDLDIPSQQEMLALFRCGEISKEVLISFEEDVAKYQKTIDEKLIVKHLGQLSKDLVSEVLKKFTNETKLYSPKVVDIKIKELEDKMKKDVKSLFLQQVGVIRGKSLKSFEMLLSSQTSKKITPNFDSLVEEIKKQVDVFFMEQVLDVQYPGEKWEYENQKQFLLEEIEKFTIEVRKTQIERIIDKEKEDLEIEISQSISSFLNNPNKQMWSDIRKCYYLALNDKEEHLKEAFKGLKITDEELKDFKQTLVDKADSFVFQKINETSSLLPLKMHRKFDEEFKYDAGHIPRVFNNAREIKDAFSKARNLSLEYIDLFFLYRLNDSRLDDLHITIPQIDDANSSFKFPKVDSKFVLKNEQECKRLYEEFVYKIESSYSDAQRTMLLHTQNQTVPMYFWILLLVLGWNELTFFLFNPLYLAILIIVLTISFTHYQKGKVSQLMQQYPGAAFTIKMIQEKLGVNLIDFNTIFEKEEVKNQPPKEEVKEEIKTPKREIKEEVKSPIKEEVKEEIKTPKREVSEEKPDQ